MRTSPKSTAQDQMYCRTMKLHASSSKSERGPEGFHLVLRLTEALCSCVVTATYETANGLCCLNGDLQNATHLLRQDIQQGYKPLLETSRQSKDVSEFTKTCKLPLVALTTKTAQEVAELRTCTCHCQEHITSCPCDIKHCSLSLSLTSCLANKVLSVV